MKTHDRVVLSKPIDVLGRRLPASRRRKRTALPVPGGKWRKEHVAGHLGLHCGSVDRIAKNDPTFPKPFLIGYGTRQTPVWDPAEIEAWVRSKRKPAA